MVTIRKRLQPPIKHRRCESDVNHRTNAAEIVHAHTIRRREFKRAFLKWLGVGLSVVSSVALLHRPAAASHDKMIRLRYEGTTATVPLTDLQNLTEGRDVSDDLRAFFEATPITTEDGAAILSEQISDSGIPITRIDVEFLAIQLSRLVGDPLGREQPADMITALGASFADDRTISLLEIVENYPTDVVRVDFLRLDQLRWNALLFIERIFPILGVIEELLPELVCDCDLETADAESSGQNLLHTRMPVPTAPISFLQSSRLLARTPTDILLTEHQEYDRQSACHSSNNFQAHVDYQQAIAQLKSIVESQPISNPSILSHPNIPDEIRYVGQVSAPEPLTPLPLNGRSRLPSPIAETILLDIGPIRPSFDIEDLDTFVETGVVPNSWRFYFNVAGINADEFRAALTTEVDVDVMLMDDWLNNILGEYLLFHAGRIIHNSSGNSNIQALRSALIFSAVDDGRMSLLEFLRNYPSTEVVVEALNLARLGSNLKREGAVGTATANIGDLLLELQAGVANEICDCENDGDRSVSEF